MPSRLLLTLLVLFTQSDRSSFYHRQHGTSMVNLKSVRAGTNFLGDSSSEETAVGAWNPFTFFLDHRAKNTLRKEFGYPVTSTKQGPGDGAVGAAVSITTTKPGAAGPGKLKEPREPVHDPLEVEKGQLPALRVATDAPSRGTPSRAPSFAPQEATTRAPSVAAEPPGHWKCVKYTKGQDKKWCAAQGFPYATKESGAECGGCGCCQATFTCKDKEEVIDPDHMQNTGKDCSQAWFAVKQLLPKVKRCPPKLAWQCPVTCEICTKTDAAQNVQEIPENILHLLKPKSRERISFYKNYDKHIGDQKEKFLEACSHVINLVKCLDVHPSKLGLDVEFQGNALELMVLAKEVEKHGFTVEGFGSLGLGLAGATHEKDTSCQDSSTVRNHDGKVMKEKTCAYTWKVLHLGVSQCPDWFACQCPNTCDRCKDLGKTLQQCTEPGHKKANHYTETRLNELIPEKTLHQTTTDLSPHPKFAILGGVLILGGACGTLMLFWWFGTKSGALSRDTYQQLKHLGYP